jgi:hypothetical protein
MDIEENLKTKAERELDGLGFDGYRFREYCLYQNRASQRKFHCVIYNTKSGLARVWFKEEPATFELFEVLTPGQEQTPFLEGLTYVGDDPQEELDDSDDKFGRKNLGFGIDKR